MILCFALFSNKRYFPINDNVFTTYKTLLSEAIMETHKLQCYLGRLKKGFDIDLQYLLDSTAKQKDLKQIIRVISTRLAVPMLSVSSRFTM